MRRLTVLLAQQAVGKAALQSVRRERVQHHFAASFAANTEN